MNLADEIRQQIKKCKDLKLDIGEINNHLSTLEGLVRNNIEVLKNEAYQKGYDKGYADKTNNDEVCKQISKDIQDEAYQRGLDDAWEAARKIADMWTRMDNDELLAIFGITERIGHSTINSLFGKQTANEAMLNLEAYEEKQKADDEIKVGDEVVTLDERMMVMDNLPPWIVTSMSINYYRGIDMNGKIRSRAKEQVRKTGRHFDIQSILEEMRHD